MATPKGVSGNPKGRPKGVPNKVSTSVKEDVLEVYKRLGGVDGLEAWVRNKSYPSRIAQFYAWMMTKLLPAAQDITLGSPADGRPALRIEVVHTHPEDVGKGNGNGGNGQGQA